MKLIIEIDEEDFCKICNATDNVVIKTDIAESIFEGIPLEKELEDIMAEIEDITTYDGYIEKLGALEIIDKHIKENKQ